MPTATSYYSQKTVTTTTTTTKTVPRHDGYSSGVGGAVVKQPVSPTSGRSRPVSVTEMNKILNGVKSDQSKNVVLDTLAALVTDVNATAEVLRSRSSSRTNVNDEGRESRLIYQLTEDDETRTGTRRSASAPRSLTPQSDRDTAFYSYSMKSQTRAFPGAVKVLPSEYEKRETPVQQQRQTPVEIEYKLRLHRDQTPTGVPFPAPRQKFNINDSTPSLEKVCKDFDIDTPRARSTSRTRSETPVSRKLIVLEEPKERDAPICAACNHPIYGACITALAPNSKRAQKYHPPHFVCNYCLKPLNLKGTYREHDLKPYCHECFYRLFSGHIYVTENKISLDVQ